MSDINYIVNIFRILYLYLYYTEIQNIYYMSTPSSTNTSDLTRLITRLLLNELDNARASTNTQRQRPRNQRNPADRAAQPNQMSATERGALIEVLRSYSDRIAQYNTNITIYNRNVENIIRIIDANTIVNDVPAERPRQRSQQTYVSRETDFPYSTSFTDRATQPTRPSPTEPTAVYDASMNVYTNTNSTSTDGRTYTTLPRYALNNSRYLHNLGSTSNTDYSFYLNYLNYLATGRVGTQGQTGAQTNGNGGLTETQINNVTERIVFDASNTDMLTQCPITLEEFTDGDELLQIRQCKHVFRPSAIKRWFSQNVCCPMCRVNVLESTNADRTQTNTTPDTNNNDSDSDSIPDLVPVDGQENTEEPIYNENIYILEFPINRYTQ
jgi:hypothetical protein